MKVREFQEIPRGLLKAKPKELKKLLKGPSLIHIRGQKNPPIFLSTLLHGNEPSGFLAVQQVLDSFFSQKRKLPRSIIWFIGNVEAAEKNVRHLDGQPDYNRIWNGGDGPEQRMARYIYSSMKRKGLFACVDIHNNTGKNPFYGCINKLDYTSIHLAKRFSNTLVYFRKPNQCLSIAFTKFCPTTTLEAGNPGDKHGVGRLKSYLNDLFNTHQLPKDPVDPNEIKIYQTFAKIEVPETTKLSFKQGKGDISMQANVESLNFKELLRPTLIGTKQKEEAGLKIIDNQGNDVTWEHMFFQDELLFLKEGVVPAMFTRNLEVIKQDCFGYLMKRCEF